MQVGQVRLRTAIMDCADERGAEGGIREQRTAFEEWNTLAEGIVYRCTKMCGS